MEGHDDRAEPEALAPGPPWGPAGPRPAFLPPLEGEPPPAPPEAMGDAGGTHAATAAGRAAEQARPLSIMAIVASVVLLLSTFLPWARITARISVLGRSLHRDMGSQAGVDADGTARLIPVLALIALGLIAWGMIAKCPRISAYAAAPGGLALMCCAIFLIRLDHAEDRLDLGAGGLAVTATLGYGWFVALVAGLVLVGLSLATLVTEPRGDG